MGLGEGPAGSVEYPYKLIIVGGGPAGVSIIVRAVRLNVLRDLCKGARGDAAGVCIIDKGSSEHFGGGQLQHYIINSNTYGSKFVSNVLDERRDFRPPESVRHTVLEDLNSSSLKESLELCGNKPAPLHLVGDFFKSVGARLMAAISNFPDSACFTDSCVETVQQIRVGGDDADGQSDELIWKVVVRRCKGNEDTDDSSACGSGGGISFIYAKKVVLATGGTQPGPPRNFFGSQAHYSKVLTGDSVLTSAGADDLRRRLLVSGKHKVVIIGGSHSAFSAAWVCLNKLAQPALIQAGPTAHVSISNANMGKNSSCSNLNAASSSAGAGNKGNSGVTFSTSSIYIIHRSAIRVFYSTQKEAESDRYSDIGQINSVTGHIHPFGGLRGDAKELWRAVRNGKETRVRLFPLPKPLQPAANATFSNGVNGSGVGAGPSPVITTFLSRLFEDAGAIIWACGYGSALPTVLDELDMPLSLAWDAGQVAVDDEANVLACKEAGATSSATTIASASTPMEAGKIDSKAVGAVRLKPESLITPSKSKAGASVGPGPGSVKSSHVSGIDTTSASHTSSHSPRQDSKEREQKGQRGIHTVGSSCSGSSSYAAASSSSLIRRLPIGGLLGTGLGFGLPARFENGELDGSSGRADGVAVYLKRAATVILASVLGPTVFGEGAESWEQRCALMSVACVRESAELEPGNIASSRGLGSLVHGDLLDLKLQIANSDGKESGKEKAVTKGHTDTGTKPRLIAVASRPLQRIRPSVASGLGVPKPSLSPTAKASSFTSPLQGRHHSASLPVSPEQQQHCQQRSQQGVKTSPSLIAAGLLGTSLFGADDSGGVGTPRNLPAAKPSSSQSLPRVASGSSDTSNASKLYQSVTISSQRKLTAGGCSCGSGGVADTATLTTRNRTTSGGSDRVPSPHACITRLPPAAMKAGAKKPFPGPLIISLASRLGSSSSSSNGLTGLGTSLRGTGATAVASGSGTTRSSSAAPRIIT